MSSQCTETGTWSVRNVFAEGLDLGKEKNGHFVVNADFEWLKHGCEIRNGAC